MRKEPEDAGAYFLLSHALTDRGQLGMLILPNKIPPGTPTPKNPIIQEASLTVPGA
jgi:hypothetical protein